MRGLYKSKIRFGKMDFIYLYLLKCLKWSCWENETTCWIWRGIE